MYVKNRTMMLQNASESIHCIIGTTNMMSSAEPAEDGLAQMDTWCGQLLRTGSSVEHAAHVFQTKT